MTPSAVRISGYLIIFTCCATEIIGVKPAQNLTSYIFSGKDVKEPVPYIVSIQYRATEREWKHFCGGSIISPNYILTAAHCLLPRFNDFGRKFFRVQAGRNNLRSRIGTRHRIASYTTHPNYDENSYGYDIALIRVQPKFKFNQRTIAKIEFDSSKRVLGDIPVIFHGWGRTNFGHPDKLQGGNFTTISDETCKLERYESLASTDLCVTGKDFSVPNVGDSGGPLVNEKKTLQIGICSYGARNIFYKHSYPTVFTRLSEFTEWIKDEISA